MRLLSLTNHIYLSEFLHSSDFQINLEENIREGLETEWK